MFDEGLGIQGKDLDAWLDEVDYSYLNSGAYVPSPFAMTFMNFIKLVNGGIGEENKTPPVHLMMLDNFVQSKRDVINLCFRGAAKTTLFMEYLCLFIAFYGTLPGYGVIDGILYISDSVDNGVKTARRNIESRWEKSAFLREWIPHAEFTNELITFTNKDGYSLGIRMFGAKTGIRGVKMEGKRPNLAILDDLIADDEAHSKAAMQKIKDTVYSGIEYAMHPTRRKMVFNGTPFAKDDIIVEGVESGGWDVAVWPVCQQWPCTEEEFVGAWPDRFTYESLKERYRKAVSNGKAASFMQEMMLRITTEEDRLVQDHEIGWYSRKKLLERPLDYNWYFTTDFATSEKQNNDFSVISVWAYTNNRDWLWVDGICARQDMARNLDDLFRLVQEYSPLDVGIEANAQQRGFITWIQQEMQARNTYFNIARDPKTNTPGIIRSQSKLVNFSLVVPQFKAHKVRFPEEMKQTAIMGHFMSQLRMATRHGLKGKDDCIDTISMLAALNPWKPAAGGETPLAGHDPMWEHRRKQEESNLGSYIV